MKNKVFLNSIIIILLVFILGSLFVCSAEDAKDGKYWVENELADCADELSSMKNALNIAKDDLTNQLKNAGDTLGEYQPESCYRAFAFTEPDIIEQYKKKGSIKAILSDDYVWEMPTTTNSVVTIQKDSENKWVVLGTSCAPSDAKYFDTVDKAAVANAIDSNKDLGNITGVKYVKADMYHISFAYISTDSKEFLVPFSSRPDFTGLDNGKIYEAGEAMNILSENFGSDDDYSEVASSEDVYQNGGVGSSRTTPPNYTPYVISGIAALIILSTSVILILRHKKSGQQS